MKKFAWVFLVVIAGCGTSEDHLKIGIIADCQYCNCDYNQEWNNDYRKAQARLKQAVEVFNQQQVDMVFHLGDFIDRNYSSYDTVMPIMQKLSMPHYFILGNHDFSVTDSLKSNVYKELNLERPYYTVQKNSWLFVVLDGTEISTYHSADSTETLKAQNLMVELKAHGRTQAEPWNGAVSANQLQWLNTQLDKADNEGLNAIVMCHFPILPEGVVNLWNDKEVVEVLNQHSSVKAFFNGHYHPGNYVEKEGIHYVTFQGMVRSQNENAFAVVDLSNQSIEETGYGREPDRSLKIRE